MKFLAALTAAVALVVAPALADNDAINRRVCASKGDALIPTINQFCDLLGHKNMVPNGK